MVFDASLLNTQPNKVWIKGNPGKGLAPSATPWCSSYWKGGASGCLWLQSANLLSLVTWKHITEKTNDYY